jgi:hypothetical protein
MQRTYSMFPLGTPGVGLVLLRLCLAASLWPFLDVAVAALAGDVVFWGVICVAAMLSIGLLTPLACCMCLILASVELFASDHRSLLCVLLVALNALALLLLGPGAYSVDARLYGHRVLTLPDQR